MKAIRGKTLIKMDVTQKEKYQLTKDVTIHLARGFNFNLREDRATMAYIIDGHELPHGTPVLVHYLSTEPSYAVDGEDYLTDAEREEGFKVRNIPSDMVFCYHDGEKWLPCKGFLITKRIFKEYKGVLAGIDHQRVPKRLYVEIGIDDYEGEITDLAGKVCIVTENSDAELIWHTPDHKEEHLIRTMNREIDAIDNDMTMAVKKGDYMVGLSSKDCVKLN